MNAIQSISAYIPDSSSLKEKTKKYGKIAAIGISIIAASSLAYYHPFLYVTGVAISTLPIAYKASRIILTESSPEKIKIVMALAIGIIGVGAIGAIIGITPIFLSGALQSAKEIAMLLPYAPKMSLFEMEFILEPAIKSFLFFSSLSSGLAGMFPYGKALIQNAYNISNEPCSHGFRQWASIPLDERLRLDHNFFDKIILFFSLTCKFDPGNWASPNVHSILFQLDDDPNKLQKALDQLDFAFIHGNLRQRQNNFVMLWPVIRNSIDIENDGNRRTKIVDILDHIVKWNIKAQNNNSVSKKILEFLVEHKDFINDYFKTVELESASIKYEDFKTAMGRIDIDAPLSTNELEKLKKEMQDLRKSFTAIGAKIKLRDSLYELGWLRYKENYRPISIQVVQDPLKQLNEQTKNNSTLFDKLQLLSSKAASKQSSIDRTDSVWNFLVMNGTPLGTLQSITSANELEKIDECFVQMKIGTLGDLIDQGFVTENELQYITKNRLEIERKISSYIKAKRNQDIRSMAYQSLSSISPKTFNCIPFYKVERVAARSFYKLAMTFAILAPMLTHPTQVSYGLAVGAVYPLVNYICKGAITLFFQNATRDPDPRVRMWTHFSRRRFFVMDEASRQDLQAFVNADIFGRLRLLSLETGISFITSCSAIGDNFDTLEVGGFIQAVMVGKEFTEMLGGLMKKLRAVI